jgi:hypothetical protein
VLLLGVEEPVGGKVLGDICWSLGHIVRPQLLLFSLCGSLPHKEVSVLLCHHSRQDVLSQAQSNLAIIDWNLPNCEPKPSLSL